MNNILPSENKGFVLIATLGVLVILSIIGMSAINTSNVDLQLTTKKKTHGRAFYKADSGAYITPKIVARTVENSNAPNLSNATYTDGDGGTSFRREVFGFVSSDSANEIRLSYGSDPALIDVQRQGASNIAGGGVEFASGAEGVGTSGGQAILFGIDSTGRGPDSASANVFVQYREVTGMPGGY